MLLVLERVSENKGSFLAGVGMQVQVELKVPILMLLDDGRLRCEDSWLFNRARVDVHTIQIQKSGIKTIVATSHSIHV